ncbi:hypothetical protein Glove_54g87 [Diversispora epigaea]|uniref:Uncharacterized protein n=1 Tax=Diversispora epigaea TaxID=1348612 RepID=A0A397JNU7_9GLOM|nr:hypothetical protein Glove_54g87 [Diversispora epigaea]
MSWKCDFCPQRIFTTKTSYTNHIKQCLKSVDSSEELSLEVMMIDSLESENLLNNENNFESIHENSNEDEGEGENEDEDNDSYNAEVEEESLTSDISHSSVSFFENMELSNSEPENYSFNNYASDYNNICEEAEPIEFPNNAYADLMALVTNYNLSNEATNALFETKLTEANIYFCEKMNDPNINDNMIKGFNQFLECFDDFLDNILEVKNIKECDIIIYAISMDSNESSDYQSDEGLCYGKILLMAKIEIEEKPPLNLALVQWYDFKFEKNSYLYNCPLLKLVELYNLIPIETIDNIVYIIPRFDEDNEYFVNKYIS